MPNSKISALTASTTPLAGTETLPVVQSGVTKNVTVANLTAGRSVSVANLTDTALTSGRITFASAGGLLADSAGLTWGVDRVNIAYGGVTYLIVTNSADGNNVVLSAAATTCVLNSANGFSWVIQTAGSTKLTVDNSSNVTFNLGNLVQGTAAKGINFTANTPAAGMTSQLLNWYEEGTWTPVMVPASGTITTQTCGGSYTRMGNVVTVTYSVQITNVGTGAGFARVAGLPFTAKNATQEASGISREQAATGLLWVFQVIANSTYFEGHDSANSTTIGNYLWRGTITYLI